MRILIATDDERNGLRIRDILAQNGAECPAGHVIPLELAADRASRVLPDLSRAAAPGEEPGHDVWARRRARPLPARRVPAARGLDDRPRRVDG